MIRAFSQLLTALLFGLIGFIIYDRYSPQPVPPLAPLTEQIDHILIEKSMRRLTLFRDGKALRTYDIALGFAPDGDKVKQGDGKTPEGIFTISRRNPQSSYHLSLGIDYPQADDRKRAAAAGVDPGGIFPSMASPTGWGSWQQYHLTGPPDVSLFPIRKSRSCGVWPAMEPP